MAYAAGTSARLHRLSALLAIVAVAVAVGFAFGRVFVGPSATFRMIALGIASGVIAWATERRGMLISTVASALGLLLAVTWIAVFHTTWFALPTAETLRAITLLAGDVGGQARQYVSPAPATPALMMAGAIAVWAAVFSSYALAFRAQSPLLGLVPPLALIVFADSVLHRFVRPLYGLVFLLAALAVLLADSLRRIQGWGAVWGTPGQRRLVPPIGHNARRVGLTALTLAAIAPLIVPGFGAKPTIHLPTSGGAGDGIHLSSFVSIGSVLNDPDASMRELFRVRTEDTPSYWRMQTLDTFDGSTWLARTGTQVQLTSDRSIPGAATTGTPTEATITFTSDDLLDDFLFAPSEPTSISIDRPVTWDATSSSLSLDAPPEAGLTYTVTASRANPTSADLRLDPVERPEEDLIYPSTVVPTDVRRTAIAWTDGALTPYEKVLAIIDHLSHFTYDRTVSYATTPQSWSDFLAKRRGFCQQFAGLMALMLRELGIPARVAVGFTSGSPTGEPHTYAVTAANLHAWVEVPFAGYGWLTFDPTPSVENDPSAARYQPDPTTSVGPPCLKKKCGGGGGQSTATPPPDPGGRQTRTDGGSVVPIAARSPVLPLVVLAILVALAAIAIAISLARGNRRRRRLHAAKDPRTLLLATYDVFSERAGELGWGRAPEETPGEFRRRLDDAGPLNDEDGERLDRLTEAVVHAAYSPRAPETEAVHDATADADAVLDVLRDATPLSQRLRGRYRRS